MRVAKGDIWKNMTGTNRIVVPTNGFVRNDGLAVMGAGIAQQCAKRFPTIRARLGAKLISDGNNVYEFTDPVIITFPVKHNWWEPADLNLISKSAVQLMELMEGMQYDVYLPRVGCGNGGLTWDVVFPVLETLLEDERIVLVSL